MPFPPSIALWKSTTVTPIGKPLSKARRKDEDSALQHEASEREAKTRRIFRKLPFRPTLRFLYVYLWQGGILDGWPGYVFARLHAQYEFLSQAKAKAVLRGRKETGKTTG